MLVNFGPPRRPIVADFGTRDGRFCPILAIFGAPGHPILVNFCTADSAPFGRHGGDKMVNFGQFGGGQGANFSQFRAAEAAKFGQFRDTGRPILPGFGDFNGCHLKRRVPRRSIHLVAQAAEGQWLSTLRTQWWTMCMGSWTRCRGSICPSAWQHQPPSPGQQPNVRSVWRAPTTGPSIGCWGLASKPA